VDNRSDILQIKFIWCSHDREERKRKLRAKEQILKMHNL